MIGILPAGTDSPHKLGVNQTLGSPDHQPYLTAIAEELNERPRHALGFLTPRESFQRLLLGQSPVASTG